MKLHFNIYFKNLKIINFVYLNQYIKKLILLKKIINKLYEYYINKIIINLLLILWYSNKLWIKSRIFLNHKINLI
jgi:hypothetical protein